MTAISSSLLSVVVQGPVVADTRQVGELGLTASCIRSVRSHLPKAEVILSTFHGQDLRYCDADHIVTVEDPGALLIRDQPPTYNNINRQIASTLAGLKIATRPYALKLRSDMRVVGDGFLRYLGLFRARCSSYKVFHERLIGCTQFSSNVRHRGSLAYHPSDWFFAGTLDDLLKLWDIPFAPEPATSRFFDSHDRPAPDPDPSFCGRCTPEQYIWTECLKKFADCTFRHLWHLTDQDLLLSELSIANNFVLLEPLQAGILFVKYQQPDCFFTTTYSYGEWLELYRTYCNPQAQRITDWGLYHRDRMFSKLYRNDSRARSAYALYCRVMASRDAGESTIFDSCPSPYFLRETCPWRCETDT